MGQGLLWGRTWGWLEVPWLGLQCQTLTTSAHHHVISLALPLHEEFSGATGGWWVQPLGCWA